VTADPDPPISVETADPVQTERYLHEHIPISAAMGIRVARADLEAVELYAALGPNINHRSTAFGGSSISLAILAAWTLVHLHTQSLVGSHQVVIRHSEMEYLAPISDEFRARCDSPGAEAWGRFGQSLHRRGKAQITLTVLVTSGGAQTGSFAGTYAAIRLPAQA
jgi:thioesterase domain-containing protein